MNFNLNSNFLYLQVLAQLLPVLKANKDYFFLTNQVLSKRFVAHVTSLVWFKQYFIAVNINILHTKRFDKNSCLDPDATDSVANV